MFLTPSNYSFVGAFWGLPPLVPLTPAFTLSSHRCPTYANILASFLVHQKWSFLIVFFLFHYWFLKLSRKRREWLSLCCHAYIGSPEGSYRYKSVLIRPLHSILKIRRRARIRSLRSRKTPSKAVAIIQVKSPEGLVMLSKEEKEGIDRKDIMVAKMSRISKKLHQSLDEGSEPR